MSPLSSQRGACSKTLDIEANAAGWNTVIDSPPPAAFASIKRVHKGLATLLRVLDDHVVGQTAVKEALLLGLLAREHIYIEGPPGVAKTFIAELVSESTSLSYWFYQMHRDTRLNEIIGEAIITKDSSESGEIIRQNIIRGGILNCEIAVLDDISRAPGEALNVFLRILNERKYGSNGSGAADRIPLLSAIATGNPAQDEAYYAEPLDPATLDRFTLQVRVKGLVNEGDWTAASEVIDKYSGPPVTGRHIGAVERALILEASELVPLVVVGDPTKAVLLEFLRVLHEEHDLGEGNSLLTDRTFLIKAIKILKARAVLDGRHQCQPQDLFMMRHLTTFRVPSKVHDQIDQIIAGILTKFAPGGGEGAASNNGVEGEGEDESEIGGEWKASQGTSVTTTKLEPSEEDSQFVPRRKRGASESTMDAQDEAEVENLEPLLRALKGRLQQGTSAQMDHSGGMPRSWSKLRSFSDITEADPISTALWCSNPNPQLPRSQRRTRPRMGGRLAIVRDTSLSMMGPWTSWSSLLCPAVVELAKPRKMKVGYLEFNDVVDKFVTGDSSQFFTRDYETLTKRMKDRVCQGYTNYELPLDEALTEFGRRSGAKKLTAAPKRQAMAGGCNQHILFLTDGHPSSGDRNVVRQIEAAQALGVSVHTIFVGYGECPPVLDRMSLSTKGSRHAAQFEPGTCNVQVVERSREQSLRI